MLKQIIIFRGVLVKFKRLVELYCLENKDISIDTITNLTDTDIIKSIKIPTTIGYKNIDKKIMFFKTNVLSNITCCDYIIGYHLDTIDFVNYNSKTSKWSINNTASIVNIDSNQQLDDQLISLCKYFNIDDIMVNSWVLPTKYI